jgi:hypothetical protein
MRLLVAFLGRHPFPQAPHACGQLGHPPPELRESVVEAMGVIALRA